MKARYLLLLGVLAVLSGCGKKVPEVDIEGLTFAEVSYAVDGTTLVIDSNLIFENDKVTLRDDAVKILRSLYRQIDKEYFSHVRITSHCDDAITERSAMELTDYQAQVVAGYLWFRGVDAGEIEAVGQGFSKPVADMATVEGVHTNQRIEILLT